MSSDGMQEEMFEHFRLVVDPGQAPVRVDSYMSSHLEDTSRSRIQNAIKAGYVRIGGEPVKAN
ncbi:MAG: RNA pseudouridine synthase, partial [Bacteroidales bacterium]|nr:RNA pseudouridine synthase [Bacteroidales bacterium]